MERKAINPKTVARPIKPTFSQAVRAKAGELLFISGQVGFDREGRLLGKGDAEVQTRQTIENIKAILKSQGAGLENILKVTVFLRDMKDFEKVHKVRAEYFKKDPPASTLVQVVSLVHPDMLVEIEAVAALD